MANKDEPAGEDHPVREAKAEEGERGMSSVAMRARKGKPKRETKRKRQSRTEAEAPAGEKPEQAAKGDGEQTIRKGIYLSALIWVEGDWPAARDFTTPAKAAARDAIEKAFEGEFNGLTLKLKKLEARTDVEEDDGEAKQEEKFEF